MKNVFTALVNKIAGSDFSSSIGGRFYADIAPEGCEYPYCVFSVVSSNPDYTFTEEFEDTTIQFSIYSTDQGVTEITTVYSNLISLFDECTLSISGETFIWMTRENVTTLLDAIDTPEGTLGLRHWAIDYLIQRQL